VSLYNLTVLLSGFEILLGITVLVLLIRGGELRLYWPLLGVSMWQAIPFSLLLYLRHLGKTRIAAQLAYRLYYFTYWTTFSIGAICAIILTYTVLHTAMRPLKGLQRLANIVYFWAAGISLFVALDNAVAPYDRPYSTVQAMAVHFQRASGLITVSLILFVLFAIRPMGLSIRSRVVGTGFGLLLISVMTTLQANFLLQPRNLYSWYAMAQTVVSCFSQITWIWYFSRPEPKRKFVLLAATSPFHRWNAIAEQFGQEPGYVAIGGIPPDAFASAEIEIFHRASAKMNAIDKVSSSFLEPKTEDDTEN